MCVISCVCQLHKIFWSLFFPDTVSQKWELGVKCRRVIWGEVDRSQFTTMTGGRAGTMPHVHLSLLSTIYSSLHNASERAGLSSAGCLSCRQNDHVASPVSLQVEPSSAAILRQRTLYIVVSCLIPRTQLMWIHRFEQCVPITSRRALRSSLPWKRQNRFLQRLKNTFILAKHRMYVFNSTNRLQRFSK